MPTEASRTLNQRQSMSLGARRVFRLSLTVALSLVIAYSMALSMPYIVPIFALMLTVAPSPPPKLKGLLVIVAVAALMTSSGLLIVPLLIDYPASAVLVVLVALFLSNYITVSVGQVMVGMLLTIGITLISAIGTVSFFGAIVVIKALLSGIAIAVICQWVVYPLFPEDSASPAPAAAPASNENALWISLRATLIVMPAYLACLTNPMMYMPLIMKTVALGQQSTVDDTNVAARTMLGSTLMGGMIAVGFWFLLKINVSLWMFFLGMLLITMVIAAKIYGVSASKYSANFWSDAFVNMLILLGPAVADSANGKDVYQAFAVRMGLFVVVTIYASLTVLALDHLRASRRKKLAAALPPVI
ncbi:MAG: hypothetical protein ACI9OF_002187 [Saprospiraceae bacterium]|jgi:hypothetical protein